MLKKILAPVVVFLCCCMAGGVAVSAETLKSLHLDREQNRVRLVLNLSAPVKYSTESLSKPERLVVDLSDSRLTANLKDINFQGSPIQGIRSGIRNGTNLRLVLDLATPVKAQTALLTGDDGQGDRLIIEFNATGASTATAKAEGSAIAKADNKADSAEMPQPARAAKPVKTSDGAGQRDIIIAIDAGHGGDDPGAIGSGRLEEKRVTIAIAKELAAIVERERGYKAVLTRNGDYFLPLKTRRDLARKAQADLMVSVHADAFSDRDAEGGSVFALSDRGATSTMAAFLAESENQADAIGGVSIEGKDDDLVKVLTDLSLTATMDASLRVGRQVLNSMSGMTSLHSRRVEQAAFVVLKSPDTPSILVETGFVSNPKEARRLASREYQQQMARSIFNGINRYFNQNPPPNTYLAWVKRKGSQPRASNGDTLASTEP